MFNNDVSITETLRVFDEEIAINTIQAILRSGLDTLKSKATIKYPIM